MSSERERKVDNLLWSEYSSAYDELLLRFSEYRALIDLATELVADSRCSIDVGAGTGNGTLRLLDHDPQREVWALEPNPEMAAILKRKLAVRAVWPDGNVHVVEGDHVALDGLATDFFDAAMCVNVFYAVDDAQRFLDAIHRVLRGNGALVLSTTHAGTDIERVLETLKAELVSQNVYERLRVNWEAVYQQHQSMRDLIHRDSLEAIRTHIERAGFEVVEWREKEYVDALVVVKALKK